MAIFLLFSMWRPSAIGHIAIERPSVAPLASPAAFVSCSSSPPLLEFLEMMRRECALLASLQSRTNNFFVLLAAKL
jgi:hypothetical protein